MIERGWFSRAGQSLIRQKWFFILCAMHLLIACATQSTPSPTPSTDAEAWFGKIIIPEANVYSGPGSDHEVVGQLYLNDEVVVLASSDGWYKIAVPSSSSMAEGWVYGELVQREEPTVIAPPTPTPLQTEPPAHTATPTQSITSPTPTSVVQTATPRPSLSPTETATVAPSPTPSKTVTPTQAVIDTPSIKVIRTAPSLLSPAQDSHFRGPDAQVIFGWDWTGDLGPDEYYVITIAFPHYGERWYDTHWVKEKTFQAPRYLYDLVTGERRCKWSIQVIPFTETKADGTKLGEATSPPSEAWEFVWDFPLRYP